MSMVLYSSKHVFGGGGGRQGLSIDYRMNKKFKRLEFMNIAYVSNSYYNHYLLNYNSNVNWPLLYFTRKTSVS